MSLGSISRRVFLSALETTEFPMSAMKVPTSRQTTPLVSRALKTVGIIMILAALLDMFILLIPVQVTNRQWLISAATQMVDRGIIPMIGIALLLTGHWVEGSSSGAPARQSWQDSRFWAAVLASILSFVFLLLTFLHPNNVRLSYQQAAARISREASQAETQIDGRIAAEVDRQRALINQLTAASDAELDQAVQTGAITQEQAQQIRAFKEDPSSVDPSLQQQAGEAKNQLQTEIGTRREQAQRAARIEALKSGLRIGLSSLLLSIGYAIIGWTGLKALGQGARRSS